MSTLTRATITDDTGAGTDGTVWNAAAYTALADAIDACPWTVVTTTSTGTQNNFAPGLVGHTIVRCNNASLLTINGLASGVSGQRVLFVNVGTSQVDLAHLAAATTAANRFITFAAVTTSLAGSAALTGGTAEFIYDGTTARWRMVTHEQGDDISYTPTLGGTGGTAIGNGTLAGTYAIQGKRVFFHIQLTLGTTTVIGTSMTFALPVTGDAFGAQGSHATSSDVSASQNYIGGILNSSTSVITVVTLAAPAASYATAVPFTWANTDFISINGWYFAA